MIPLFRSAVIDAQRRRLFGSVTLWQPVPLMAFTAVAVVATGLMVAYLMTGTYARKETVKGWLTPAAGQADVRAVNGGVVAAVAVKPGDWVQRGQTVIWMDMASVGGSAWNRQLPTSGMVLTAPVSGQVVALTARPGEQASPQISLLTIAPEGSPLEARLLVPTRAAGMVKAGQDVRLMIDAFPFQRFGAVDGVIHEVARAVVRPGEVAAPIEFKEAVYTLRVHIERAEHKPDGGGCSGRTPLPSRTPEGRSGASALSALESPPSPSPPTMHPTPAKNHTTFRLSA